MIYEGLGYRAVISQTVRCCQLRYAEGPDEIRVVTRQQVSFQVEETIDRRQRAYIFAEANVVLRHLGTICMDDSRLGGLSGIM